MRIKYNFSAIMLRALQMRSDAQARGEDRLFTLAYCLKQAWRGARADRFFLLDGMTAGGHGLCIVMED